MRKPVPRPARWACSALLAVLASYSGARAQSAIGPSRFTDRYSVGVFAEDMPTSSHILLGISRQREMIGVGAAFTRRLFDRRSVELDWLSEIRPLLLESDPTLVSFDSHQFGHILYFPAMPIIDPGNLANKFNYGVAPFAARGYSHPRFSRRWTYAGGASPFEFQLNGFKRRRLQPEGMVDGGFLVATQEIPIKQASYFDFVFQFGGGIEWYRTASQSILLEFRVQHFSNGHLGTYNPGTDGGLWKLTYRFGRE